jgi:conjugative transfer ATPase
MVTGGELAEEAKLTRADRLLLRNAILNAAAHVRDRTVLTEDVAAALRRLAVDETLGEARRARAVEMSDAMSLFCSGLAGHFFNRPGEAWPDVDVTILEMGILANEGYEDQLTVAYMGMMQRIHELAERTQYAGRPLLVLTDEGHLITTNPLLAPYVVKIVKLWRKLGAWLWIATQNLEDFPDVSRKMLNLFEWWLCLSAPKEEVEQIGRFRELTAEERTLLLAARKSPGQYTEGVVLSRKLTALFRNVPPPLAMALAQTEAHEKAARADIMRERGCSELEAAYAIAEQMEEA